jgi:acyl-CoA synthetase (AMP-forming)/AMP-acid ligase II
MTANVAEHLTRLAAESPAGVAVVDGRRRVTYADLNARADALAHGLTRAGLKRGERVALLAPPSVEFFALTFGLLKLGAVPVLIDPGMGVRGLGRCLDHAEVAAFVGIPKAQLARKLLGWAKSARLTVTVGNWRLGATHSTQSLADSGLSLGAFPAGDFSATDPAAVLFTSGSTGPAKGVSYEHGHFAAQVEILREVYKIVPGEVDYCTFPLFALFGPALGMTCVVPTMNPARPATIDPATAFREIAEHRVTNLFGSPAVVRRLGSGDIGRDALSTVKRVISAGAPARLDALEALAAKLPPGVEIFTPYGATEALPVANVGTAEILGETAALTRQGRGVCVGRPVPGVTVAVIAITDGPVPTWDESLTLPPGEVGEFVVRGPVVTREYFRDPAATALAKIQDPMTGETLHRMGDVGYLDDRGRLWFCGRKAHRVATPQGLLFTDQVEPVFNEAAGVFRTALVGVTRDGTTHPVLCVERLNWGHLPPGFRYRLVSPPWLETAARLRELAATHPHTASVVTFLPHPGFPVDPRHNSKIAREKVAYWADVQLGPGWKGGPA